MDKKKSFLKINKGFTLAEVLVTLAVIGVIASMTIPAMVQTTTDRNNIVKWKKSYSNMQSVLSLIKLDNNGSMPGYITRSDIYSHLKTAKVCSFISEDCWTYGLSNIKRLNGQAYSLNGIDDYTAVLADGSFFLYTRDGSLCNISLKDGDKFCGYYFIDVNGARAPNTIGKDIFAAFLLSDGTVKPVGYDNDNYFCNDSSTCIQPGSPGWDQSENSGLKCSYKYLTD